MRENLYPVAVSLWFLGTFYLTAMESWRHLAQVAAVGWLFLWGMARFGTKFLIGPAFEQDSLFKISFVVFVGWSLVSATASSQGVSGVAMLVAFCAGFLSCAGAWKFIRLNSMMVLRAYAVGATCLVWVFWIIAPPGTIRFWYLLHPNHWGSICFGAAISALAFRSWNWRLSIMAANLFIIMKAESRTSLLCVAISLCTFMASRIYQQRGRNRLQTGFFIFLLAGAGLTCLVYMNQIADAIESALFIHDRVRGTGSGFTGRTEFWKATWNIFLDHPIFGVGPRVVEQMQSDEQAIVGHSGYLVVLADLGLPGAVFAFTMIGIRAWRLWTLAKTGDQGATIGFSIVVSFLLSGVFEMRLLNVGDPIALLSWVFLLMPRSCLNLPVRAVQRVARPPVRQRAPYYQPLPRRI